MVIAVIRIVGRVNVSAKNTETFNRLNLGKKLTCIFIDEKDKVKMGMLKSISQFVSFGNIDEKIMNEIISKRGQKDSKNNYVGFCRLHPPRGGFKRSTKINAPKGILNNNKEIAKLLERML